MIRDPHILAKFLYEHPEAWPVRMALIEELVRDGDIRAARALVRESPDDPPMPPEFRFRIHTAFTAGAAGVAALPPLLGFEDRSAEESEHDPSRERKDAGEGGIAEQSMAAGGRTRSMGESAATSSPASRFEAGKALVEIDLRVSGEDRQTGPSGSGASLREELTFGTVEGIGNAGDNGRPQVPLSAIRGGSGALVEIPLIRGARGPKPPPPPIDRGFVSAKWEGYSGALQLSDGRVPEASASPSPAVDRFSALATALLLHALFAIAVSLVVIHVPRPNPPELVVTLPDENDGDDLIVQRLTRPAEREPSAAAAQAVNVETSLALSGFALPEVEDRRTLDVTAMVDGLAEIGAGMSLSEDAHRQSDVNFFGISSGGERVVFIIDADPGMLVDEKGGMFAYDKVKNEIAAVMGGLNRGTRFNLMIYEGKRVVAFRDELVPALPSNKRLAVEWMDPLNRDYGSLGLRASFGETVPLEDWEELPVRAGDVGFYTKSIQKAMEWRAAAIFCITSGYERMGRSLTEEMKRRMMEEGSGPDEVDERERERWEKERAEWLRAVAETREWLEAENAARREKGMAPKVVIQFAQLVREITGAVPPRPPRREPNMSDLQLPPPVTPEEIEEQFRKLVKRHYRENGLDDPSVHLVLFLGEEEEIPDREREHFGRLTRQNRGKFKLLRGLAALEDLTGKR